MGAPDAGRVGRDTHEAPSRAAAIGRVIRHAGAVARTGVSVAPLPARSSFRFGRWGGLEPAPRGSARWGAVAGEVCSPDRHARVSRFCRIVAITTKDGRRVVLDVRWQEILESWRVRRGSPDSPAPVRFTDGLPAAIIARV
jgi:hypothetical protein